MIRTRAYFERLDKDYGGHQDCLDTVISLETRIADLEHQRDVAHAAAIQAVRIRLCEWCARGLPMASEYIHMAEGEIGQHICDAISIFSVTPADAQRLYDLRIAEARLKEATWWSAPEANLSHSKFLMDNSPCQCEGCKRLASASAEVEQLKGGTHGQDEAPSAAASANSEPGGA